MKSSPVILFATLTVLICATGTNVSEAPSPKCFWRRTKCCWKYSACGVTVVRKPTPAKCPVKACGNKCFDVCKPHVADVTKRKCWKELTYKKDCHEHPWLPKICVDTPLLTTKCDKFVVKEAQMRCKKACTDVCSVSIKDCSFKKVYHYPKYCPKLSCAKAVLDGDAKMPAEFVAKTGKFIRTSQGPRKDKIKL